ncbi:MAG: hypothetical protein NC453_11565 [Muribaculum sp.]|nr:hypothetical protein [Muribaculum sp.]
MTIRYGAKEQLFIPLIECQIKKVKDLLQKYRYGSLNHDKVNHEINVDITLPELPKGTYPLIAYMGKKQTVEQELTTLIDLCQNSLKYDK